MKFTTKVLPALLLITITGIFTSFTAQAEELGEREVPTRAFKGTTPELLKLMGDKCQRVDIVIDEETFDDDEYHYVDPPEDYVLVRPEDHHNPVKLEEGEVDSWYTFSDIELNPPWNSQQYFCDPVALTEKGGAKVSEVAGEWESYGIAFINLIFTIFANLGVWLMWLASQLVGLLLAKQEFINHPFVRTGWPFLLGIANLSFIVVLLFIAFATTLQLEFGNVRRWLPRLLISAILINFSLIISGVIIDVSRLIMAAIAGLLGMPNLSSIGDRLLQSSDIINSTFQLTSLSEDYSSVSNKLGDSSWTIPLKILQAGILIWALAIAMWYTAALLFVRYIALILLLIASPLAYLSWGVPNMDKHARQWWGQFLKWVFYGPIVLFLLVLAAYLGGADDATAEKNSSFITGFFNLAIVIAILMSSATIGKSLGGAGASAAIGFMDRNRRRVTGYSTAAGIGAAKLTGQGAAWLAKTADKQLLERGTGGRVGVQRGLKSYQDYRAVRGKAKEKEDKKQEKARQESSIGTAVGRYRSETPDERKKRETHEGWARDAKVAKDAKDPALDAKRLLVKGVRDEVSTKQIKSIADRAHYDQDNDDQLEMIITNADLVKKMDAETPNVIITDLKYRMSPQNTDYTPEQKKDYKRLYQRLTQTVKELEQQAEKEAGGGDTKGK